MPATNKSHVIVIGAGVTGLQSAITLLEAGHDVTIVAKHQPGDESIEYTSPWAGAMWRTHASAAEPREQGWDMQTYEHWAKLLDEEERSNTAMDKRCGVTRAQLTNVYSSPDHPDLKPTGTPSTALWFAGWLPGFHELDPPNQAPYPAEIQRAWRASAFVVDVPQYLRWLRARVEALGGVFSPRAAVPGVADSGSVATTLAHAFALASESRYDGERGAAVFVNAAGIGARALVGDPKVYPVRGQVHVVKGVAREALAWHRDAAGAGLSYVIPRPRAGVTVVGGCKEKGSWRESVDDGRREEILDKCALLLPELLTGPNGTFEVVSTQVGLRPAREGGARIEKEKVQGGRWIVHAYGHSGAGYQNSIGSARDVLKLVEECLAESQQERAPTSHL